jgi:hypothetical protein
MNEHDDCPRVQNSPPSGISEVRVT